MGAGRMADVAEAGGPDPQTHHRGKGGGGWPSGRGRGQQERLATQRPARGGRREPGRARAPALPVDRRRGPGRHVVRRLPGRAAPGIEATLFPRRAQPSGRRQPAPRLCSPGSPGASPL